MNRRMQPNEKPVAVIFAFVVMLTVVTPLLGGVYAKSMLLFYGALLGLVLLHPILRPHRIPFLYAYLAVNVLALLLHLGEIESVLNAGSLIVSIFAITGTAYYCVRKYGHELVDLSLERSLWVSLGLSVVLSVVLTAVGWSGAPGYYPWEAFYTEARLLIITGGGAGHSPSLWIIAFVSAFTLHRITGGSRNKAGLLMVLLFLVLCLIATKSRLGLLYILNLVVMGLAYKSFPFMRLAVFMVPVVFASLFLIFSVLPEIGSTIDIFAEKVQKIVGDNLRITSGSERKEVSVFSGRDILNRALREASLEHPIRGLGDGALILEYGVDFKGEISYDPDTKAAGNESVLRLAVKYGWPYFILLVIFLFSLSWSYKKLENREQILKIGLWGMCVESIFSQGGMEIFYGISGLFLFMLCLFLFEAELRGQQYIIQLTNRKPKEVQYSGAVGNTRSKDDGIASS